MIIIIIAIFTLTTFFSWMYLKNKTVKIALGLISFAALAISVFALTIHITNHWGMKEVTKTSSQTIYSAGSPEMSFGLLITQKMGDKTILVYKSAADAKNTTLSVNLNTKASSKTFLIDNALLADSNASYQMSSIKKAKLTTQLTELEFSNAFTKALFGFGGEAGTVVKTAKMAELPKDTWLVLSSDQATSLQKKASSLAEQQKAASSQIANALAAAPSPEAKAAIEAKAKAAMSPQAEIAQIKALLGIK